MTAESKVQSWVATQGCLLRDLIEAFPPHANAVLPQGGCRGPRHCMHLCSIQEERHGRIPEPGSQPRLLSRQEWKSFLLFSLNFLGQHWVIWLLPTTGWMGVDGNYICWILPSTLASSHNQTFLVPGQCSLLGSLHSACYTRWSGSYEVERLPCCSLMCAAFCAETCGFQPSSWSLRNHRAHSDP